MMLSSAVFSSWVKIASIEEQEDDVDGVISSWAGVG
jgi:hypothetical protein